jgi:hypothetical protein
LGNSSTSSRVINGEPTINPVKEHPWMAKVYTKINTKKPMNAPKLKKHPPYTSTGTIITLKTILTCGHCVCNYKDGKDGQEQLTCKANKERQPSSSSNPKNQAVNLNVEGSNEIYYTIGNKDLIQDFNKNIKVFLYNYDYSGIEPRPRYISKNGDMAVVINIRGLGLDTYGGAPICLPSKNMFLPDKGTAEKEVKIDVKLIGSGTRSEVSSKIGSSCFTNQGVTLNTQIHQEKMRDIFLPCKDVYDNVLKDPVKGASYCYKLPKDLLSISSQAKLVFSKKGEPSVKCGLNLCNDCHKM